MRRSQLFGETLRETPAEAETTGYALLLRAACIQPIAAGIYSFLPLGERVKAKIERILREEMIAIECQEVSMPVVQPAELWQESGRYYQIGPELLRFRDRGGREMVLAMTHEEVVAALLRQHVRSYRQLPVKLFQIQTKFRDEPRARGGLIRVREFVMKDAYSCHADFESLDEFYPLIYQAYFNVFRRSGLEVVAVQSDVGMMGGTMAHEFIYVSDIGEDHVVLCEACGYAANRQIARFKKEEPASEELLPVENVATPGTNTIATLADFLQLPEARTAKATFFMAGDRLIFAVVRGDMEVNETKLLNAIGASELRAARVDELEGTGIVPGYASPIGIRNATVVVDELVARSPNLVAGANRPDHHLRNTNFGRDYQADIVADISMAYEGAACVVCGQPLKIVRGVEVGNIFKLGTKYSEGLGATYLDADGQVHPIVMGSYGIGVGRLIGSIAQGCNDERGLIWPITVAPFEVYLVGLDLLDQDVARAAESLYEDLEAAGVEVLFDDREERAGVKFNDADLLGIPLRITVSRRTLVSESAELKLRTETETRSVPLSQAASQVGSELRRLREEIMSRALIAEKLPA